MVHTATSTHPPPRVCPGSLAVVVLARLLFKAEIDNLGYIPCTPDVSVAAMGQTPIIKAFPSFPATAAVVHIDTQLIARPSPLRLPVEGGFLEGSLRSFAQYLPRNRREPLQEVWAT